MSVQPVCKDALVACKKMNQAPDTDLLHWLGGLAEDLYRALAGAGLVEPREEREAVPRLGVWLDRHIASRRGEVSPRSIQLLEQTKGRLIAAFGSATPIDRITASQALDWRQAMLDEPLSEATVRLHTRNAKAAFNDAVERELIARSPFKALPSAAVAAEREFYLPLTDAEKIIQHLPDREHKLLFGLARFGGLRVPSETHLLEWPKIDWSRRRMVVYAPKTGETREVPIVPRLFGLMRDAYEHRDRGFEQVLLMSTNNLHRTLIEAITHYPDAPTRERLEAGKVTGFDEEFNLERVHQGLADKAGKYGRVAAAGGRGLVIAVCVEFSSILTPEQIIEAVQAPDGLFATSAVTSGVLVYRHIGRHEFAYAANRSARQPVNLPDFVCW